MSIFTNKDIGLNIVCVASADKVKNCDEVVKSLTVNLENPAR